MPIGKEEKVLFNELDRMYSSRSCPVLFVFGNLSPFYANASAQLYYPALCKNGLSPFVADKDLPDFGVISLSGNQNSPFEKYILSPVSFPGGTVFRVQILGDSAAEERMRAVLRRDSSVKQICGAAEKELRRLTRTLNQIRKGFGDVSSAEVSVRVLREMIRKLPKQTGIGQEDESECFDPYQLLRQAEFCLRSFRVRDLRGVSLLIYADKAVFLRSVLLGCGYLNRILACRGEISCTVENEADDVILSLVRKTSLPVLSPDELLARCEETLTDNGGKLSFSLLADGVCLLFRFPGHCYSPADFTLSEKDIMEAFAACEDLESELDGLISFERSGGEKKTPKSQ